jgi:hypothetical protein
VGSSKRSEPYLSQCNSLHIRIERGRASHSLRLHTLTSGSARTIFISRAALSARCSADRRPGYITDLPRLSVTQNRKANPTNLAQHPAIQRSWPTSLGPSGQLSAPPTTPDKVSSQVRNLPTSSLGLGGLLAAPKTFTAEVPATARNTTNSAQHPAFSGVGQPLSVPVGCSQRPRPQPDKYPVTDGTCPLSRLVPGCSQRPRPPTAKVPVTIRNTTTPAGSSGLLSALRTRHRQGIQSPTEPDLQGQDIQLRRSLSTKFRVHNWRPSTSSVTHYRSKSFRDTPPIE